METGDEETDGETTTGTEEEPDQEKKSPTSVLENRQDSEVVPKKSNRYHDILSGKKKK